MVDYEITINIVILEKVIWNSLSINVSKTNCWTNWYSQVISMHFMVSKTMCSCNVIIVYYNILSYNHIKCILYVA